MNYLEKYANDNSRFMVIDGTMIHYRDEGTGPALLCLHGAFSSLHTFDGWAERLSSDYRVLRLDLPGFGLSGCNPDHQYAMDRYLDCVSKFLDRMGEKKCVVAGSSLGGWLAWEFVLKNPNRVTKLVLIGSAGFLDPKCIPSPFRMARTPFISHVIKYVVKKNLFNQYLHEVFGDPEKITPEMEERYFELFAREGNPEAFLALANGKYKDNTKKLKKIKCPTLVMWGEEDKWLPVEVAYRFEHRIPNSELVIYEGAGHIPMEEIPDKTAHDMRTFLKKRTDEKVVYAAYSHKLS